MKRWEEILKEIFLVKNLFPYLHYFSLKYENMSRKSIHLEGKFLG
jgi:hypothetical protein